MNFNRATFSVVFLLLAECALIKDAMKIRMVNLKCENVDPTLYNATITACRFTPTRDGAGVTNFRIVFGKPIYDVWAQIKIFYRYPMGVKFIPFMVDIDLDLCTLMQDLENLTGFAHFYVKSLVKNAPGMLHNCPFFGEEGLKDADINKIMGDTIPQVIPKGYYKMLWRLHLKNNHTMQNIWLTVKVDAVDGMKSIQM